MVSMRAIWQDLRFGLRIWQHRPGLTAAAVLTLALGIAVNAVVFSWIDSILLHPLPGVGHASGVYLLETATSGGEHLVNTSYTDCGDYTRELRLVSALGYGRFTPLSVGEDGRTGRAFAELVSGNYFQVLEVKPVLGRGFRSEEARRPGAEPVAVISYRMWQSRYASDPRIIGKSIRLNRHNLTIVGVAPRGFHGSMSGIVFDVWVPITMAPAMGTGDGTLTFRATRDITSTFVRLRPGVHIEQARAELAALARRLEGAYPGTNRGIQATFVPIWAGHLGAQGILFKPLMILLAMGGLLLLMACANVANLLLARTVARQKEFSLRLALGARRSRLARQLFAETFLLALGGAAGALVLMAWMGPVLQLLFPPTDIPIDIGGTFDLLVAAFVAAIVCITVLISGTAPALFSVHADLSTTLKEGGRGGSFRTAGGWRRILAMVQIALAVVALTGAGLFLRSFHSITGIHPGFDMQHVSVSQFYLSNAGYSAQEQWKFCRDLRRRVEGQTGVTAVTYSDVVPLASAAGSSPMHLLSVEGYVPRKDEQVSVHRATVPPGYFEFMKIPRLAGRDFTEDDTADKPALAMIVNQAFAAHFFPGRQVIGRKVSVEGTPAIVVGLVHDSKYHALTEGATPFFYLPFQQWFRPGLNFAVFLRAAGDPLQFTTQLRREALALNQDATFNTVLLTDAATASLYPQRVAATLLAVAGAVCLLLAAIGIYSVMSYTVSQRTRELGIRIALGARPLNVRLLVLGEGLRLTIPGLAVGLAVASAAGRFAGGMLVGVAPADAGVFSAAACFVAAVALAAGYLPSRRAIRVDPMRVLNTE